MLNAVLSLSLMAGGTFLAPADLAVMSTKEMGGSLRRALILQGSLFSGGLMLVHTEIRMKQKLTPKGHPFSGMGKSFCNLHGKHTNFCQSLQLYCMHDRGTVSLLERQISQQVECG